MNRLQRLHLPIAIVLMLGVCAVSPAADTQPTTAPVRTLSPGVKLVPNLEYASVNGKSLLLDLYLPRKIDKPLPVVMWVHGGGWFQGDKKVCPAIDFATHGYAVVSINYRFSQEATYPAQIQDCKAAVRWIRAHAKFYSLDGARIGAWGESAGGHLVALLGTTGDVKDLEGDEANIDQSSRVQAVCDFCGPTDFLQFQAQAAKGPVHNPRNWDAPDSFTSRLIGGTIQENKEKAARANPITFITRDAPPFLIMHGDRDKSVPLAQSEIFRDALVKAGVDVRFEVIHGVGHGLESPARIKIVEDFFDSHLKPTDKAPGEEKPKSKE
jgi:acetyl esterase/lipase